MKKFKSLLFPNKEIVLNGKSFKFKDGFLETDDKELIALFQKDGSIVEVTSVADTVSKRTKIQQTEEQE